MTTKSIALFDLDGTLYRGFTWQALREYYELHRFKLFSLYKFLFAHLPLFMLYKIKLAPRDLVYTAWGKNMAWLLQDVPLEDATTIWNWIVEQNYLPHIRPEMKAALEEHLAEGMEIAILSGSFQQLLEPFADRLNIAHVMGTPLAVNGNTYTGRIVEPLNVGQWKLDRLNAFFEKQADSYELENSYFYTDSIVDLPVMEIVGHPVAVYPDQQLATIAEQRGWQIIGEPHAH
ncbi:MAG: HAD-IB family hydrolase [Anaerolineales bacterium]|nr:HAD-IB family hydrolase [Anaerolineales bacterium]